MDFWSVLRAVVRNCPQEKNKRKKKIGMRMKKIHKIVFTSVVFILICSLGYNIYLSNLNRVNKEYYEQILRVRIENDATLYNMLNSGNFELLQKTIVNDFAFFSKEMEKKYDRKLSISKDLDYLVRSLQNK